MAHEIMYHNFEISLLIVVYITSTNNLWNLWSNGDYLINFNLVLLVFIGGK